MKIAGVATSVVALPANEPLADAPEDPNGVRPVVTLKLFTDEGVVGIGLTYFGAALSRTLRHAVQQLGEITIGDDPLAIDAIVAKLRGLAGGSGPGGIFTLALSAIEIALWDIAGKVHHQPLWKMVGGSGNPVPTYASGALMRGLDDNQVARSAERLVESGFTAMKFQLALPGDTTQKVEMNRARLIRSIVGPSVELMCDINQRWTFDTAMEMGQRLEEINLTWLEDPIVHDDYSGLSQLSMALKTPVAAGEYVYGISPFRHLIDAKALDVVMIDPFRAGGIGEWLRIARLANEAGLRVVSHLAPEIQLHLISAVPNGWIVEYMPWFNLLYNEVAWPAAGLLTLPQAPGLGVSFNEDVLARYCVERQSS